LRIFTSSGVPLPFTGVHRLAW